jgi:hypothetical protein
MKIRFFFGLVLLITVLGSCCYRIGPKRMAVMINSDAQRLAECRPAGASPFEHSRCQAVGLEDSIRLLEIFPQDSIGYHFLMEGYSTNKISYFFIMMVEDELPFVEESVGILIKSRGKCIYLEGVGHQNIKDSVLQRKFSWDQVFSATFLRLDEFLQPHYKITRVSPNTFFYSTFGKATDNTYQEYFYPFPARSGETRTFLTRPRWNSIQIVSQQPDTVTLAKTRDQYYWLRRNFLPSKPDYYFDPAYKLPAIDR